MRLLSTFIIAASLVGSGGCVGLPKVNLLPPPPPSEAPLPVQERSYASVPIDFEVAASDFTEQELTCYTDGTFDGDYGRWNYEAWREPLRFSLAQNLLQAETTGFFWAQGRLIIPGQCGWKNEAPLEFTVRAAIDFPGWSPDWSVSSVVTPTVEGGQRCNPFFFGGLDLTPRIRDRMKAALDAKVPTLQEKIAKRSSIKERLEKRLWPTLATPQLKGSLWVVPGWDTANASLTLTPHDQVFEGKSVVELSGRYQITPNKPISVETPSLPKLGRNPEGKEGLSVIARMEIWS